MFDKLDAYNLVANLIPGAALTYALNYSGFPTPPLGNLGGFLLASFVLGVTTNRLGSLLIDPFLRYTKFLQRKDYTAFVTAQENDQKLETLVANAGLYRTFFTAGLVYLIFICAQSLSEYLGLNPKILFGFALASGMLIFIFAFRKEDGYIKARLATKSVRSAKR